MPEYLSPGIYVEDVPVKLTIQGVSSSTGAMEGISQRGKVGEATFLTSWDSYLRNYAKGVDSPFMANSDLAYSVYGFFQNGGRRLYVNRVASESAKKAKLRDNAFAPAVIVNVVDDTDTPVIVPEINQILTAEVTLHDGSTPPATDVVYKWVDANYSTVILGTDSDYTVTAADIDAILMVIVTYKGKTAYWKAAGVIGTIPEIEPETNEPPVIEAKDEGVWGNRLRIYSVINEDIEGTYNVTVNVGEDTLESYFALSNDRTSSSYWVDTINSQTDLLNCISGYLTETPEIQSGSQMIPYPATFEGGEDGIEDITDDDYIKGLTSFDKIDDITLIAIPGQTSRHITDELMSYVERRRDLFAILDAPRTNTVDDVRMLRRSISCKAAGLPYPWIRVNDPLSRVGALRDCPTAGHVMGVYARLITERGVWKAPAGTEAIIRGALEVVTTLTTGDTDVLNPIGIISILPKTNYGITIWGARSISPDTSKLYVSDILLYIYIYKSIFIGTQPFVFEPNNQRTWTRLQTTVESFLDSLWRSGGLFGTSPAEAYFVRCDAELNPEVTRNQGLLFCEVGYASSKPAEFVVFRISHELPKR